MPKLSSTALRNWYAKFSKEVYEKAQIDVNSKEDLGRVKTFEIKNWDRDNLTGAEVDFTYAYMPQNEAGYLNPVPSVEDFEVYSKWLMDNLNPKLTDDVIRNLVGHAPQPDTLTEWIENRTFKKGDYKPDPYELPKSAGYESMTPELLAALRARSLQMTNAEARCMNNMASAHTIDTLHLIGKLYNTLNSDPNLMQAANLSPEDLREAQGNMALYDVLHQGHLAEEANLRELMRGDRVDVGRTFALGRKVGELAENAVNKMAKEQLAKEGQQPAKNLQAPDKQEQIQPKQMEMKAPGLNP